MRQAPSRRSKRPFPRALVAAVAVVAVAAAAFAWWRGARSEGAESAWRTVAVERGDIRVAISATGTLSATSTVTVGSQISGQVTQVLVDFNDRVTSGQVLARIDPSTYEAQIEQGNAQIASARAQLEQAQATLRNAELDYRRKAELVERQLVARSDVDLARAALEQARAQVASAQAQIRQQTASTQTTRVNLDRTVIRSPVDGVVLTRSIEPGQTVAASLQAPELFTIAEDLSKMRIELAVDEADIGQVQAGQQVTFTADAFPDRQFRGVVDQVRLAATTTNNVVTYPVVVSVDNSDGTLLPGLTVNAEIEVSNRKDVLKVSNAALRYKPVGDAPAPAAAAGRGGAGMLEDLRRIADGLDLDAGQRAAFDAALEAQRKRAEAMRQGAGQGQSRGPGGPPPGMMVVGGGTPPANVQAQIRQRMLERMKENFADFTRLLDESQRKAWDAALASSLSATRATIYRLRNGQREAVQVRVGASDGTSTEISGPVEAGDEIITGERARR
ncbi:efflux RND transporter periplasmic adaptor subunit [Luteimonas wenzhouensis]|uniref:Efflux RND transporter periplasmic adaptor subunit n=1 Tax=Luteimonas wenzhouensis TaxID=2599615 RepID=A0A5C5U7T5_9GAMM|nr:efflux RND transporter periplasmic adaptor subunit [Luteimonas wenzhouensis]NLW96228.1 efflux RND transporter periplasmic adaptor subunit [Xanthomonadaceae bacterium]TWT21978.1 efflux RND transporter periplasmic adaptor subunit [Luteimonas wenzhouensis]